MIYQDPDEIVVVTTDKKESSAVGVAWAIALVIIIAIIVGAVYYSGIGSKLLRSQEKKTDVTITVPAR